MHIHRSSPWPLKTIVLATLYFGAHNPLAVRVGVRPFFVYALLLAQTAVLLPSLLLGVQSRETTTQVAVLSLSYLTSLAAAMVYCEHHHPDIASVFFPFAAAHLLYHQFAEARARPRTFNNGRTASAIALCASVAIGLGSARACEHWPSQLTLLVCAAAGEILGVVAIMQAAVVGALAHAVDGLCT